MGVLAGFGKWAGVLAGVWRKLGPLACVASGCVVGDSVGWRLGDLEVLVRFGAPGTPSDGFFLLTGVAVVVKRDAAGVGVVGWWCGTLGGRGIATGICNCDCDCDCNSSATATATRLRLQQLQRPGFVPPRLVGKWLATVRQSCVVSVCFAAVRAQAAGNKAASNLPTTDAKRRDDDWLRHATPAQHRGNGKRQCRYGIHVGLPWKEKVKAALDLKLALKMWTMGHGDGSMGWRGFFALLKDEWTKLDTTTEYHSSTFNPWQIFFSLIWEPRTGDQARTSSTMVPVRRAPAEGTGVTGGIDSKRAPAQIPRGTVRWSELMERVDRAS